MKNIEVEIRGPLNQKQYEEITKHLKDFFVDKGRFNRYVIDFTTPELYKQNLDVRARVTNGQTELVVKVGEWGTNIRQENIVKCENFKSLVNILSVMVAKKGIAYHRVSERFEKDDMEIALIIVPGHSMFYEAEICTDAEGALEAEARLVEWAKSLGLEVWQKEGFLAYVDILNKEANDKIDLSAPEGWNLLEKRLAELEF